MALYRKVPKCVFCGEPIAKSIRKDESKIPPCMRVIGDTFIRWEYELCNCKEAKKARSKNKNK